jgi:hypothetical protein
MRVGQLHSYLSYSSIVFHNAKIKIYKAHCFTLALYGRGTWPLGLKELRRMKTSENGVQSAVFVLEKKKYEIMSTSQFVLFTKYH